MQFYMVCSLECNSFEGVIRVDTVYMAAYMAAVVAAVVAAVLKMICLQISLEYNIRGSGGLSSQRYNPPNNYTNLLLYSKPRNTTHTSVYFTAPT